MSEYTLEKGAPLVIAMIVMVVILAVGANVLVNTQNSIGRGTATLASNNNITVNESVGEQVWSFLPSGLESPTAVVTGVVAFNATLASQIYTSGNYTVTGTGVNWATATANGTLVSFNFTTSYSTRSFAFNSTEQGLVGINQFANFVPVLAIIFVLAIIIGLLAYLQFGRKAGYAG